MVAADDQVGASVVPANQGVPERLAGTRHSHGERQQRQLRGVARIVAQNLPVAADARVVIEVSRLRHADDRVDQQVRLQFAGRPQGQLEVRPMHRVAGLEGDRRLPSELREPSPQLLGRLAQSREVVVPRRLDPLDPAAHGHRVRPLVEMGNAGMGLVESPVDEFRLLAPVVLPDVVHREHHQRQPLQVAQNQLRPRFQPVGSFRSDVKRDRNRPQRPGRQAHRLADAVERGPVHEPVERRESAAHQQLQIADLARRQGPGRPLARSLPQFVQAFRCGDQRPRRTAAPRQLRLGHHLLRRRRRSAAQQRRPGRAL